MNKKGIAFIRSTEIYDDSRATKEIIALEEVGNHIIVIGWDRGGNALEKCMEVFKGKNIRFFFYNKIIKNGIGLNGILHLINFMRFVYKVLKENKANINYVHACDLDSGLPGNWFCKFNNKPLVYDIYDYYVDCHAIPTILSSIIERLEIGIINNAETTIICTEERVIQIKKAKPKRVVIIHNSPEVEDIKMSDSELEYDYVYCGVISEMRLIEEIVSEYGNHQLCFLFAGNGKLKDIVQKLSEQYEGVSYRGSVPYEKVLEYERKSKILSAIYDPRIRNHQLCAPNKFYEALALSKPIIVCRGTGIDKVVEKEQLGIVINYDAVEFYEAVEKLIADPALVKKMGMNAHKLYERKYHWKYMKERLISIYDSLE